MFRIIKLPFKNFVKICFNKLKIPKGNSTIDKSNRFENQ